MTDSPTIDAASEIGSPPPGTPDRHAAPDPSVLVPEEHSVVLSAEQLVTATEWVESGHVRLRRRIVSETRRIDVVVRREELVLETRDTESGAVGESLRGTVLDGPAVPGPDGSTPASLVLLLREEVPTVVLQTQAYERVTAELVTVGEVAVRHDDVRHEEVSSDTTSLR